MENRQPRANTQVVQLTKQCFFLGILEGEFFLSPTQMGATLVQPPGFEPWWRTL
jgi:hypothetical protein